MSNPSKDIRKQIRNVMQEVAPEILSQELMKALEARILKHVDSRLDLISDHIKATLNAIDSRTKDVQSMVVRQSAGVTVVKPGLEG